MKFTNDYGLPDDIVRAMRAERYSRGDAVLSVTQLLTPPRIIQLRAKHDAEVVVDARDELWKLLGQAVHEILDRANAKRVDSVGERRLFATVNDWRISGAMDRFTFENGELKDYKVTSVYAVGFDKPEWEQQLNLYAWLMRHNGHEVSKLSINAILRDWRKGETERDPNYPKAPVKVIDIPLWSFEKQEEFVRSRVNVHQQAEMTTDLGGEYPPCSDEERWLRDPAKPFQIWKKGNKRPSSYFETELAAMSALAALDPNLYTLVRVQGEPTRCMGNWCGVAPFCKQHQQWLKDHQETT